MYLIALLPQEINDDILVIIGIFNLAIHFKRYWVASQLFDVNKMDYMTLSERKSILMVIIHYLDLEKKTIVFLYASRHGYDKIVMQLLKDPRVDPLSSDNFAIRIASYRGHEKVVEELLKDHRVDPSADDNYAIQIASKYGYEDVVKLLLADPRVDPNVDEFNEAIRIASEYGYKTIIRLLQIHLGLSKK